METDVTAQVLTEASIENLGDLWAAEAGHLSQDQVRRITVYDALVDTRTISLALPTRLIQQLGLSRTGQKRAISYRDLEMVDVYGTVRLTIQGRQMTVDVLEVRDEIRSFVGQIVLGYLDLVPDPRSQRLIGNPAHGGEHILDML